MDALLCWIEHHPGLAGWLQAIGSLLAIAIAIMVPYWQARKQGERAQAVRDQELHSLEAVLSLEISHCIEFLEIQAANSSAQLARGTMMRPIPPSVRIFDANCGKLGLLKPDVARVVLEFYQQIDALQRFVTAGECMPVEQFATNVRAKADKAQKAIEALSPTSTSSRPT